MLLRSKTGKSSLWRMLLILSAGVSSQAASAATELAFPPEAVDLTPAEASTADKARILRLGDGTLVVAWHEGSGLPGGAWGLDGATYAPRDIFVRVSADNGETWSDAVNVSNTAQLTDPAVLYDRVGDGSGLANYYGDSGKAGVMATGNHVLVAWNDSYCGEGLHGPAFYDGELGSIELPFRCLYAARLIASPAGVEVVSVDRLTDATRDVTNEVVRATGAGFAMAWQEDPAGLQLGEARGEGDGASGARTTPGTDVWYTWLSNTAFEDPGAAWHPPVPISDNFDYGEMTVTGGGASRPIMAMAGSPPTALLVYEESKHMGPEDVGKHVRFHQFKFNSPPQSEAGVVISTPGENGRRARVIAMTGPGKASGSRMVLMWRQGTGIHGAPADFMMRVGLVPAGTDLGAVPNAGFRVEDLWPAVDPDDPLANEAALNISGASLDDASSVDPLANAKAHRAVMDGDFIYAGYTQDEDADDGVDEYQYLLRWSADGGKTWAAPTSVSQAVPGSANVIEPRLLRTPGTVASGDPRDVHNPDVFIIAWGTETRPEDGSEPYRDALFVTRSVDRGLSFERVQALAASRTAADQTDEQIQLRVTPDGQSVVAVWIRRDSQGSSTVFNSAAGITPTADLSVSAAVSDGAPDVGETFDVSLAVGNLGPQRATELALSVTTSAGLSPVNIASASGDCRIAPDIRCTLVALEPGDTAFAILELLAESRGPQTFSVFVEAWEEEPSPLDNNTAVLVEPVPHADLEVTASTHIDRANAGQSFNVDFDVVNHGPQFASGIELTASVGGNALLLAAEGCEVSGAGFTCGYQELPAGTTWSGTAVLRAVDAGTVSLSVSANALESDPQPANNSAYLSIGVSQDGASASGGGCVYAPSGGSGTLLPLMLALALVRLLLRRQRHALRAAS